MLPALFVPLALAAAAAPAASWPGFRGDGTSTTAAANLPLTWSPTENVAWRAALPGYGQSSPAVWGGRAYLTAVAGENKEKLFVVAVDTRTGAVAWTKTFTATQKGKNNPMMSRAAGSPVADAAGVVAFFESGDVVALTPAGEVRWQRALTAEYGEFKNNHGLGSSPAHTEKAVVVLVDHAGPSYLLAIDKATGKNLWMADRPARTSWTSPVVADLGGKAAVVVSGGGAVTAYDAGTGKEIATADGLTGNTIPSPAVSGGLVVVGAGENRMKPDLAASAKSNCALRLTTKDGKPAFETAWTGKKAISHHASPVVYRGHAYFVTKLGFVHCLDLKTGDERYAERLDNPCWATPVGANGHVYFFGKDGVTTVLKAGPEYHPVATNRLWSAADFARRKEAATAATPLPARPEGKGPGGGPPVAKEELDATRYSAVGDVVYGVAAVDGLFLVRTGTELIAVRGPSGR